LKNFTSDWRDIARLAGPLKPGDPALKLAPSLTSDIGKLLILGGQYGQLTQAMADAKNPDAALELARRAGQCEEAIQNIGQPLLLAINTQMTANGTVRPPGALEIQPVPYQNAQSVNAILKPLYMALGELLTAINIDWITNQPPVSLPVDTPKSGAYLISEDLRDGPTALASYFKGLTGVRLKVGDGPNFGNQSTTFALIENLRRLGYAGGIDVLVNDQAPGFDQTITSVLTFGFTATETEQQQLGQNAVPGTLNATLAEFATDTHGVLQDFTSFTGQNTWTPSPWVAVNNAQVTMAATAVMDPGGAEGFYPTDTTELCGAFAVLANLLTSTNTITGGDGAKTTNGSNPPQQHNCTAVLTVTWTYKQGRSSSNLDRIKAFNFFYDKIPGVKWITGTTFDDGSATNVKLVGLVGADDAAKETQNVKKMRTDVLKCGCLAVLQPYKFNPLKRFVSFPTTTAPFSILTLDQAQKTPPQAPWLFSPAAFRVPAIPKQAYDGIFKLYTGKTPDLLMDSLESVQGLVKANKIGLMTIYGLHQAYHGEQARVMDVVSLGLLKALETATPKGVAVVVVHKGNLATILSPSLLQRDDVSLQRLDDSTTPEKLTALSKAVAPQLLILHSGALPNPMFQMLCQESTWPIVIEGANTTNMALDLGIRSLSVNVSSTPYFEPSEGALWNMDLLGQYDAATLRSAWLALNMATGLMVTPTNGNVSNQVGISAKELSAVGDSQALLQNADQRDTFMASVLAGGKGATTYAAAMQDMMRNPLLDQTAVALLNLKDGPP